MRRVTTLAALVVGAAVVAGCVDNDQSFYIEHIKMQPEAPGCEANPGDPYAASGMLDLAARNGFSGWYYVTNGVMIREDYDNLDAESDGIFVDGMEVYVTAADGTLVGGSEYFQMQMFIEPEQSAVVPGVSIPASVVAELADAYGCPYAGSYDLVDVFNGDEEGPVVEHYGAVYSVVRFLGHTQGNYDVETQNYTFPIELCCNCLIEWDNCTDPCGAFCDEVEEPELCTGGVANGTALQNDCRGYYHNESAEWLQQADGGLMQMDCEMCSGG